MVERGSELQLNCTQNSEKTAPIKWFELVTELLSIQAEAVDNLQTWARQAPM